MPASRFFRLIDTMVHKTWTSRESYCRVVIEAYAHGVVPIVEDDFAFPEVVLHGLTGFRTSDSDEMSYYATRLAWDPKLHLRMARQGRDFLRSELVDARKSWAGWEEVLSAR
jgi:glycosyltransferase involved in cell wall biosynthesis